MREIHMVSGQAKELFILPRVRDMKDKRYKIDIDATHYLICNAINRITFRTPSLHSPLAILYYITPTAEKITANNKRYKEDRQKDEKFKLIKQMRINLCDRIERIRKMRESLIMCERENV